MASRGYPDLDVKIQFLTHYLIPYKLITNSLSVSVTLMISPRDLTTAGNGTCTLLGVGVTFFVCVCVQGVRTVCLQLNNLELGDYTFTLKVTDTGGNTGTADVHVYVKHGGLHFCL